MDCKEYDKHQVIDALKSIRITVGMSELEIQDQVAMALSAAGILFDKEKKLSPSNRIDFLVAGGIGIEVKKGKVNHHSVVCQLERYLVHEAINEIILISEQ